MKGLIVNLLAGCGLFAGALAGTLAATGRLNREGVANIPGLAALFPVPAGTHAGDPNAAGGADGSKAAGADAKPGERGAVDASHAPDPQGEGGATPSSEHRLKTGRSVVQQEQKSDGGHGEAPEAEDQQPGPRRLKTGRSVEQPDRSGGDAHAAPGAEPAPAHGDAQAGQPSAPPVTAAERDFAQNEGQQAGDRRQGYRPGAYFRFEGMPAGVTAEKINEAWQRVQEVATDLEHKRAALDMRERELSVLADDIARRQSELGRERTDLEALQKRLEERIEQFKEQVKLVRTDEVAGLRRNAATLAAFEPQKAAELVQDQWKTERGQDEILKTLEFMDKDAVNAILQALPNSMVREVLEKRLRVSKETPGAGGKGG